MRERRLQRWRQGDEEREGGARDGLRSEEAPAAGKLGDGVGAGRRRKRGRRHAGETADKGLKTPEEEGGGRRAAATRGETAADKGPHRRRRRKAGAERRTLWETAATKAPDAQIW